MKNNPTNLIIQKAAIKDAHILSELGKTTFIESHGNSASKNDIQEYVSSNYTVEKFEEEINDPNNHYYLIFYKNKAVGFSKICMNCEHQSIDKKNIAKLERLYVLQQYHGNSFGFYLFEYNINLCKESNQSGVWLNVWVDNLRAINFYKKMGFEKIGDYSFKISSTHSNPNHQLFCGF